MKDNFNLIRNILQLKKIVFSLIPMIVLIIILETSINAYSFFSKSGHFGFPFRQLFGNSSLIKQPQDYRTPWDFKNNKMQPGNWKINGINYSINKLGFRGEEFNPNIKNKIRIICFGGSSTFGLESSDDNTYPAKLQKSLNESGIESEVLNFGFSSKSLNFITNLFYGEAIHYKPDLITIFSNRNTAFYDANTSKSFYSDINVRGRKC